MEEFYSSLTLVAAGVSISMASIYFCLAKIKPDHEHLLFDLMELSFIMFIAPIVSYGIMFLTPETRAEPLWPMLTVSLLVCNVIFGLLTVRRQFRQGQKQQYYWLGAFMAILIKNNEPSDVTHRF